VAEVARERKVSIRIELGDTAHLALIIAKKELGAKNLSEAVEKVLEQAGYITKARRALSAATIV